MLGCGTEGVGVLGCGTDGVGGQDVGLRGCLPHLRGAATCVGSDRGASVGRRVRPAPSSQCGTGPSRCPPPTART